MGERSGFIYAVYLTIALTIVLALGLKNTVVVMWLNDSVHRDGIKYPRQ